MPCKKSNKLPGSHFRNCWFLLNKMFQRCDDIKPIQSPFVMYGDYENMIRFSFRATLHFAFLDSSKFGNFVLLPYVCVVLDFWMA